MSSPTYAPEKYLRLALSIERLFPGYVDAYFGPEELRLEIESGDSPSAAKLHDLAASLERSIRNDETLSVSRQEFLASELRAMRMTLRILGGDKPSIVEEVEELYGVVPQWADETLFNEAHYALDQVLPGSGSLAERIEVFRVSSRIPSDLAEQIIQQLLVVLRQRTGELFALPLEEDCQISFVGDKPWYAYNWYKGNATSLIEINSDRALELWDLPSLIAHEAYPGHHTEHAIKEQKLYREQGHLEQAIALINTPAALISEGIATNALHSIHRDDEIETILRRVYKFAGLDESDGVRAYQFIEARKGLRKIMDNQALLLFQEEAPEEDVVAYGMRFGLMSEDEARHSLLFIKDPLWRSYGFNYTLGRDLIAGYLDASPHRAKAFAFLLSNPTTPERLRQMTAGQQSYQIDS